MTLFWMKKSKPGNYSFVLFGLLILLVSCKSRPVPVREVKKEIRAEYVLVKNRELALKYNMLSFKGEGRYESKEENTNFTYKINVLKDSLIWVSISKMGIEGMRMLITPDSIKLIDKLNKEYFVGDFEYFNNKIGLTIVFEELERIFTGDLSFILDSMSANPMENVPYKFTGRKEAATISYIFSAENFKVKEIEAENQKNEKIYISYSDYILIQDQAVPKFLLFQIVKPEKNVFRFIHSRIEIDPEDLVFSFNIPANYVAKILE